MSRFLTSIVTFWLGPTTRVVGKTVPKRCAFAIVSFQVTRQVGGGREGGRDLAPPHTHKKQPYAEPFRYPEVGGLDWFGM